MKKRLKLIGFLVLKPLLLFLILTILLYIPPIQNWAVKTVASFASDGTGMEITVQHVSLVFPLDLGIEGFRALQQNDSLPEQKDTIADIRKLIVHVRILPLFKGEVVIDELSLHEAKINTYDFISDVRIKGELSELWLSSNGIDLGKETIEVNGARLADARLDVALSDTAEVDTTEESAKWVINADSISIRNTDFKLHLPGDTMNISAYMGRAVAQRPIIDIGTGTYQIERLDWRNGQFNYDISSEPVLKGFDYNHIALTGIQAAVDSFSFSPAGLQLRMKEAALKERCGINITAFTGAIKLDSAYSNIQLPNMKVRTTDSDIDADIDLDFNIADDENPGKMKVSLNAMLGKQDIMNYLGDMPQAFIERYPNHPLSIKGAINGNLQEMGFAGLDLNLPTAFHLNTNGTAGYLTDFAKFKADLKLHAQAQDLNFMTALVDPTLSKDYRIPNGLTLDGFLKAADTKYKTNLTARDGKGSIKLDGTATIPVNAKGEMAIDYMSYDATLNIDTLDLHRFMPNDSIYTLTADLKAKGYGTDFLHKRSHLVAEAILSHLQYGHLGLTNISATANLKDGRGQVGVTGHNEFFEGNISADMLLDPKKVEGTISSDLAKADLYHMRFVEKPFTFGMSGDIDITSDLDHTHRLSGLLDDLYFKDGKRTYYPKKIGMLLNTNSDTTYVRVQSGDFIVKLDASGNYEPVMQELTNLTDSIIQQYDDNIIDQVALKRLLPTMKLHIESARDNPIANLLKSRNILFREMKLDVACSPETGINGTSYLYSLRYDSIYLDTIRLNLVQKGDRLSYQGQIRNNKRNPHFVFNALIDGHVHEHGALAGLRYYDRRNRLGVRIGATAEMEEEGTRIKLLPERPTIGYKEFNLNKDNFILFGRDKHIEAKLDLISDDRTGLNLYTITPDSTMNLDMTVSLHRIDLSAVTSVLPYLPRLTGRLTGDYHILQDLEGQYSMVSDMAVADMTYEGSPIGNLGTELVYLMKEDDTHAVEARLLLDDDEIGLLNGSYHNEGEGDIDAILTLTKTPLSLLNGFIPDQIIGFEGYTEGELTIKGTPSRPDVNGEIFVDSAYMVSVPYGVRMRMDSDPVRIVGSHFLLENYGMYAYNEEPLNIMGEVDFSNLDNMKIDMRMRARNLLLINSKQEANSIAYGKGYVNFFALLRGPLEEMKMRGRLDVLSNTDMTYILLDSPLSTDNRLNELVKFTDFSDSLQAVVSRPKPSGVEADLNISVSQGAHIVCELNPDQSNYIDLMGGGDLRMKYNAEGINLTGRYTLSNGEMKYTLPPIPLKTFTIKDGSYVEFTGDPMNPKLNITATEQVKATVNDENGQSKSTLFECGVVITQTLNNMGLAFTIDAPEDNAIKGELTTMSDEERGKLAVGMLTTGMYLANDNASAFSMNSALSAFLQSEINSIAGNALKTIDLSVGVDNATDAAGNARTDYSFKFSKRFFNNRLKVQIGGKVSSGNTDYMGQTQSFFDNVSMEYRLNKDATQYVSLFYKQNAYDWLDGYTNEYGAGFIWRRKLSNFWDIFRFWKKEPQPMMRPTQQPTTRGHSTKTDSIKRDSILSNSIRTNSMKTDSIQADSIKTKDVR